jgi:hypothetical protein
MDKYKLAWLVTQWHCFGVLSPVLCIRYTPCAHLLTGVILSQNKREKEGVTDLVKVFECISFVICIESRLFHRFPWYHFIHPNLLYLISSAVKVVLQASPELFSPWVKSDNKKKAGSALRLQTVTRQMLTGIRVWTEIAFLISSTFVS